jgi:hypothetical protein
MSLKMQTFFKTTKEAKALSFGPKTPQNFNYVDFATKKGVYEDNLAFLLKQMNDSYLIDLRKDEKASEDILEFKLTNQDVLTWEDHWIDPESGTIVDPRIKRMNLQKNRLVHANFNIPRSKLEYLNLEGNVNMRAVFVTDAPKLEVLNVSNCPALGVINLGNNRSLKALLARNCSLTSLAQERLLRDFRPVTTSSSNVRFNMFRKTHETLLDMRGTEIDWSNRRVASKIRMLLCNNWLVLWDNMPPATVVPPHMYSFFTTSLEDSLIKDYYSS